MSTLSRRQVLGRLQLMAAAMGLPLPLFAANAEPAPWPEVVLPPVSVAGYGTDPDMVAPLAEPWPLTLTPPQRALLRVLSDILLPADDASPAASQVGVPDVVDHWISAPYAPQQRHRETLLKGLLWLDAQAQQQFASNFLQASMAQRLRLVDALVAAEATPSTAMEQPVAFFRLLRHLVCGAYYSSPAGLKVLGYVGNVPLVGDYPGPSAAALDHLQKQLVMLGLSA